ncbi:PREDICTED: stabilizer of axonemal microtubules 1-like [Amphimedon queenslandica]|uniref:Stabilizer of axonemal microtubules 2 n=1 Tax=Amphimedon queenslandica TaxID=400682 RepID=A0A1X7VJ01_AMPQE|nr:PREDICTED: stabilizer of axonemal microtubules 1-like [Amphimedon queenslandica]|eukprot:XP_011410085.2 PREDICTED: stabilizer of axonemal microtubules 1-like [Amphimedon queenslandica]
MSHYKCICQLCTCGRHHCPQPSRPKNDIMSRTEPVSKMGSTEYKTVFLTHSNAKPPDSYKPALKALSRDVPMTADTTNKLDYIKHPVSMPMQRPPAVYKKPDGSMANESEYKKEYRSKTPEPAKPILPPASHMRSVSQPFQGQSTQARDYVAFTLPPREFYGEKRVYAPPTEPFAKTTTIKSDYNVKFLPEPTKSMRPPQNAKISRDPFEGSTCHRSDFRIFPIPEKFHKSKIAYQPPQEPFSGVTTFSTDFPGHKGIKPVGSMRPPVATKSADAPFESLTTSRQSYRKWELPTRFSRPPTIYQPPTEKFDGLTSFTKDFINHGPPEPVTNYKPRQQAIHYERPMEHDTIHHLDYKAWDVTNKQQPIRQERPYEPPAERFEGCSTTSKSYRGVYAPPAASMKPPLKPYTREETFGGLTTYKDCYSASRLSQRCIGGDPTQPNIPGYTFSHEDSRTGHKFYHLAPPAPPSPPQAETAAPPAPIPDTE